MVKLGFQMSHYRRPNADIALAKSEWLRHITILTYSLPHVGDSPLKMRCSIILRGQGETRRPTMELASVADSLRALP